MLHAPTVGACSSSILPKNRVRSSVDNKEVLKMEHAERPHPTPGEQRLAEYQLVQGITDQEVQTIYLTFAVFFPLSVTATASLLAVLFSRSIQHTGLFFWLGVGGTVLTTLLVVTWWRVADTRQEVRRKLFHYQSDIARELATNPHQGKSQLYLRKQYIFGQLAPRPLIPLWSVSWSSPKSWLTNGVRSAFQAEASFTNLMRLTVLTVPLPIWAAVLVQGALEHW